LQQGDSILNRLVERGGNVLHHVGAAAGVRGMERWASKLAAPYGQCFGRRRTPGSAGDRYRDWIRSYGRGGVMTDPYGEPPQGEGVPRPDTLALRPPRRRTRTWVVGTVAATVVLGGAVATLAVLATRHGSTQAAITASASATGCGGRTPARATRTPLSPPASPEREEFTFPQRIGPLTKDSAIADDEVFKQDHVTKMGVIHAFFERYVDATGYGVVLYGGNGRASAYADMDADQVLDDLIKITTDAGQSPAPREHRCVRLGNTGGALACAPMANVGVECGWKLDDLYLEAVVSQQQPDLDAAGALMGSMLDAIVLPR
jgi:hypothetical protein